MKPTALKMDDTNEDNPTPAGDDIVAFLRNGVRCDDASRYTHPPEVLREGITVCICTFKRPESCLRFLDSLPTQEKKPDRLVIVDASPGNETEQAIENYPNIDALAQEVLYFHVRGAYQTLTCSRNFAVECVDTDLMVFFDDDIVLLPGCLDELVRVHRQYGDQVVGVNAHDRQGLKSPTNLWKVRRLFRIVPHLKPGAYARSGVSIPWVFQPPTDDVIEGDWLSGCAMSWKTAVMKNVRFNENFGGHSTGEDLDVSLRMARHGKLMLAGKAHVLHLPDQAGRPNTRMMAYAGIHNAYDIHRRCMADRSFKDAVYFMYAYGMDTLLRGLTFLRPGQVARRWNFIRGRCQFFADCLLRRPSGLDTH